jgi:hypothetical protein
MNYLVEISFIVVLVIAILYFGWIYIFDRVTYKNHRLVKKGLLKNNSINIVHLNEIKFHYHAVVGFISVWEFIDSTGNSLEINGKAKGLKKVLLLEQDLAGFSLNNFKQLFDSGDVVDTLEVWNKMNNHHLNDTKHEK